jgi:hypothetical protein
VAAQNQEPAGKPIGSISTDGDLIVLTLDEGALGHANLFDLGKHTLRFTPDSGGYRVENAAFTWDPAFGDELPVRTRTAVALHEFAFPFSGRTWNTLTVDATGSIGFGDGVTIGRFDQLQNAARTLVNKTPAICVFEPRCPPRYVKRCQPRHHLDADRAGGDQDFTWTPTVNRSGRVVEERNDSDVGRHVAARTRSSASTRRCRRRRKLHDGCRGSLFAQTERRAVAAVYVVSLSLAANSRDLACTVLKALGDKFDFLASSVSIDNQEAGATTGRWAAVRRVVR